MGLAVARRRRDNTQEVLVEDALGAPHSHSGSPLGGGSTAGLSMLWNIGGTARFVIAVVIALQLLVPLIQLSDPPAKFGFQMYSGLGGAQIAAVDDDGQPVNVDQKTIVAGGLRPDIHWVQRLPHAVCERVPAAAQVTVKQGTETRTVSCAP